MFNAKSLVTVSIETIRFADYHLIILTTPNKLYSDLILCSHLQRCVNFIKITGLHAFTTGAKLHKRCKDSSKKKICVHIWTFCKWSLNSWPHIILAQRCKSYANVTFTVIATDSKSSAISVFALEQIWAKLCKGGICYTFAVVWLPVQIHFFVQCMIAFEKQLYLT